MSASNAKGQRLNTIKAVFPAFLDRLAKRSYEQAWWKLSTMLDFPHLFLAFAEEEKTAAME
jgi:hypothetical protein